MPRCLRWPFPTTLRDSLLARLDRLAPIREIAQIGACIGREFSYELLAAVSPLKGVRLDEALEQLTKTGLVSRRGTPPDAIYIFKHALVQDAAYDSLLKSKRAQLHTQIAKVLEKDFSDTVANEPELLAHHFTQAGLTKQAIGYWHLAGERAGERLAYAEAIAYFQRGIELAGTLPDAPDVAALELGLQIGLGFAFIPTKGYTAPESLRAFTRAQALCQQAGETAPLFSALRGLFSFQPRSRRGTFGPRVCRALPRPRGAIRLLRYAGGGPSGPREQCAPPGPFRICSHRFREIHRFV